MSALEAAPPIEGWVEYLKLRRSELVWRWTRACRSFLEAQERMSAAAQQLDDVNAALSMAEVDSGGPMVKRRRHLGVAPPALEPDEDDDDGPLVDPAERAVQSYRLRLQRRPEGNSLLTAASALIALEPGTSDREFGRMARAVFAAELVDNRALIEREANRLRAHDDMNGETR